MDLIKHLVDFILHIDVHLDQIIRAYGLWTYAILALIVFVETGVVVMPFLPGDSLLFAAGAFAARGSLNVAFVFVLLAAAAIIGDNTNYWIGRYLAPRMEKGLPFVKAQHIEKTNAFYAKYGGKAVIIARFMPIIRTFSPFVAGVGAMRYRKFLAFDIAGGVLWVGLFTFAGFFFGNIPAVKERFTLVILAIIVVSVTPAVIEFIRHRRSRGSEGRSA